MPVQLKDVEELMIEDNPVPTIGYVKSMPEEVALPTGFNKAIEEQGLRKIGLNGETLAEIVYNDLREGFFKSFHRIKDYPDWANADNSWRTTAYRMADAIIARESEILEYKP